MAIVAKRLHIHTSARILGLTGHFHGYSATLVLPPAVTRSCRRLRVQEVRQEGGPSREQYA